MHTDSPDTSKPADERRFVSDSDLYFNSKFEARAYVLSPGETLSGSTPDRMLVATIGSGILISVYDLDMHVGAAGYVVLPDSLLSSFPNIEKADPAALKRALEPIDACINEMKRSGAGKSRIRIRLSGGSMMPGDTQDRGTKTYIFVREYLQRKGLVVVEEDIGGHYVRRVHFFPDSGRVVRWILRRDVDFDSVRTEESTYQQNIARTS